MHSKKLLSCFLVVAWVCAGLASLRAADVVERVESNAGKLVLVAGGGNETDGGLAIKARLRTPYGVGFDGQGNMYVGEIYGHKVRKVDTQGVITTVAGTGEKGYGGDGGPALAARFYEIHDLVVARSGDIYIADSFNYRIRKVDGKTGMISQIAGAGKRGLSGDGGPATEAGLDGTASLCLDAAQEKLYSTGFSKRIRVIDLKTGVIDSVPGIAGGRSVAVDSQGNIYVGDREGVRVLEPGAKASRLLLDSSKLELPIFAAALCVDQADNLYIADMKSQTIRRYAPATKELTILVGCGKRGRLGLNGPALEAQLADPHGVNIRPDGTIFFADSFNYRVVRVAK
jgi:DNA-binding beta-propeller fold protein YncE